MKTWLEAGINGESLRDTLELHIVTAALLSPVVGIVGFLAGARSAVVLAVSLVGYLHAIAGRGTARGDSIPPLTESQIWFLARLTEEDEDVGLVTRHVLGIQDDVRRMELVEKVLTGSALDARVAFMNRAVRRGRPFAAKQIAAGLGITEEEAERRKHSGMFSNREVAKIMGITEDELLQLKGENPPIHLLNTLVASTSYVDQALLDRMRAVSDTGSTEVTARHGSHASKANVTHFNLEARLFLLIERLESTARDKILRVNRIVGDQ